MTIKPVLIIIARVALAVLALALLYLEHASDTATAASLAVTWAFCLGLVALAVTYDVGEYEDGGNATISWAVYLAQRSCFLVVPIIWAFIAWWPEHWAVPVAANGAVDWPKFWLWWGVFMAENGVMLFLGGTRLAQRE